jgi:SAM-dependent methyltransferase
MIEPQPSPPEGYAGPRRSHRPRPAEAGRNAEVLPLIDKDYLDAAGYDLCCGAYAKLPEWFVAELKSRGDVLELACGTGRIAIPLAQQGIAVTGLDYSKPMLDLARKKAKEKKVQIQWVPGDMRSFDLKRKFGTVLLLYNALWHLHELSDLERCLACVRRHLKPGGVFILDVFTPSFAYLTRDPNLRYPAYSYVDPQTGELVKFTESYRYEPDTQMARAVRYLGETDQVVGGVNLRMYFPRELDALLKYNGLAIQNKYGSWDREPFFTKSQHQLYFCEGSMLPAESE